jgi:Ni/Fe-hydrogenase subunit HybB-like protein
MNLHSIQILALILASAWAVASAKYPIGRLLTPLFILASMAAGLVLGFVSGMRETPASRGNMPVSMMIFIGLLTAIGYIFRNQSRPFTAE